MLDSVFTAYTYLGTPRHIEPITMGLINKTYKVTTDQLIYVLQEMSPIFETTVIEDGLAVSLHLERAGINAPTPYLTKDGTLFCREEGRIYRAIKFIDGHTSHTVSSPSMAESAGRALGRFHLAMMDFNYDYRSRRRHAGDYQFHRDNLTAALKSHAQHDYFARAKSLADMMITSLARISAGLETTPRHAHGDPKISNILFEEKGEAICLVDFDTLGRSGWSLEMGDALRSWCNPHPEDVLNTEVDLSIAEAALSGYGSVMRGIFSEKEIVELIAHTQAISLCLATRYLADVLNEKYFRFDQERFTRSAEHQWLKAQAMHNLFEDFARKEREIAILAKDLLLPR